MPVAPATLRGLRSRYQAIWSHEWPHEDKYLAELWTEARHDTGQVLARVPSPTTYDLTLELMRECHEFEQEH